MTYIGIDVGGTSVKAGVVDERGAILATAASPSAAFDGDASFLQTLKALIRELLDDCGTTKDTLRGIGVGIPGAVQQGKVLYTCNLPLDAFDLAAELQAFAGVPVEIENDANCATAGEWLCGAGRGAKNFLTVTLGTGVGSGFITDGKLYTGGGFALESGHMTIRRNGRRCGCSRRGCWEQYASATALVRKTRETMRRHPESNLHKIAEEQGGVSGKTPFAAALSGDETAIKLCARYAENVAAGVVNLINLLHPDVVAIGGGISGAPEELLFDPVREIAARESYAHHADLTPRIVRAELGNQAGIVGAALLHRVRG